MICKNCQKEIYKDGESWLHAHSNLKMCGDIAEPIEDVVEKPNINVCPGCGGPADNGFDRCYPPSPYFCTKCDPEDSL